MTDEEVIKAVGFLVHAKPGDSDDRFGILVSVLHDVSPHICTVMDIGVRVAGPQTYIETTPDKIELWRCASCGTPVSRFYRWTPDTNELHHEDCGGKVKQ